MLDHPHLPWEHPLGARPAGDGHATFRVWSRKATPQLLHDATRHAMTDEGLGVWSVTLPARHGDDYAYVIDGERLPDPCSRFQPHGLRGPSRYVDPGAWEWTDAGWDGLTLEDLVIYELHVGTFTPEGTFDAVIEHLPALAELGITALELMPVADFPGRRGWGYDGVYPWATHEAYGGPEGLARLVDAAHRFGLGVILDIVPNHVGASGEQALRAFADEYFTGKYSTFWGQAINYDDAWSGPVREWICQAAEGWARDFHLDGLRLDAIHAVFDQSAEHLVAQLARRVHQVRSRALVIAESGLNDPKVVRPGSRGGWGCDGAWADDVHHALRTLVTDERGGYYADFGTVADLAHALRDPHVDHGGWSPFRERRFGASARDCPPEQFVVFSQNHDQVGNRAFGDRMPAQARPLAAFCTILSPYTPMLFMGEEYGEDAPFQFFTDHIDEEIAIATREGRRREFAAFTEFGGDEVPDPQDARTFERSILTRVEQPGMRALYRRLLEARRTLPPGPVDGITFDEDDRWVRARRGPFELVMNFAGEARDVPTPAVAGGRWRLVLGTHDDVAAAESGGAVALPPLGGALVQHEPGHPSRPAGAGAGR
jgi:maltooligosyltrehalose trehalohydrolase